MTIHNLEDNTLSFCEAQGLARCFQAYADQAAGEDIMDTGFNPSSGYVYIALENGVIICSLLGSRVQYLVTNYDNGEEQFFYDYYNACRAAYRLTDEA